MSLFDTRKQYGLSQKEAAAALKVPLRTYVRYEKEDSYGDVYKRRAMIESLDALYQITENKGLLTVEQIKTLVKEVFDSEYSGQIEFCYLFGSYAKGYAKEDSDVDLLVSTSLTGIRFVGVSEAIREKLHKKIDLIRFSNIGENMLLINEIMKDGIKIYG